MTFVTHKCVYQELRVRSIILFSLYATRRCVYLNWQFSIWFKCNTKIFRTDLHNNINKVQNTAHWLSCRIFNYPGALQRWALKLWSGSAASKSFRRCCHTNLANEHAVQWSTDRCSRVSGWVQERVQNRLQFDWNLALTTFGNAGEHCAFVQWNKTRWHTKWSDTTLHYTVFCNSWSLFRTSVHCWITP